MFDKDVYISRRKTLVEKMGLTAPEGKRGIALFVGNVEAAALLGIRTLHVETNADWTTLLP